MVPFTFVGKDIVMAKQNNLYSIDKTHHSTIYASARGCPISNQLNYTGSPKARMLNDIILEGIPASVIIYTGKLLKTGMDAHKLHCFHHGWLRYFLE